MAKTAAQTLITDLAKRLDLDSTDSTVRTDLLRQINISQHELCQAHSLKFLADDGTVTLTSGNSSVAVPSGLDVGKAMTLGRASSDGEIEHVPLDEWYRTRLDTYGEVTQTEPSYYTIVNDSGTDTFLFKPGATGGNKTIPYIAQKIPTAMTDANNSYSVLPEGWEDTLLLDDAEINLRRHLRKAIPDDLVERRNEKRAALYSSYRTTKEQGMTDREQEERRFAREELGPEK